MKKIFTTSILASAILLMGLLSGCISENCIIDNPDFGNQTEMRAVTIHIIDNEPNTLGTRGESVHIPDGTPVNFQTGRLFLVSQSGLIRRTHDIVPNGAAFTDIGTDRIVTGSINRADLNRIDGPGRGVTIPTVPGDVRRVVIVGNYANINNLPGEGAHIDEVFARELDIISQWDALNVNLIGDRTLTNANRQIEFPLVNGNTYQVWHAIYPTPVHLNPTVARFEVRGIRGAGDIQSFEVAGIFMDGFWREARVGGDIITATPIINGGITPTHFLGNAGIFNTDFGRGVHDWFDPVISGSIGTSLTVRPEQIPQGVNNPDNHHTVWSYQVFAEGYYTPLPNGATPPNAPAATTTVPRMVVRLNNVVLTDNTSLGTQFITVGRFNDVTDVAPGTTPPELTHIRPSRIYRLDYIEFDSRSLSPYPNDNLINVNITVGVDGWGQGVIRPTIPFRQSDPTGIISCVESHTFNMTSAIGGSWEFEYRWERREVGTVAWLPVSGGTLPTLTTTITAVGAYYRRVAIDVGRTPNVEIESAAVLVAQSQRMTNFPECVLVGYINGMPVRFATRNLDFSTSTGFAYHPGDVGQLFQWNRPYGWPAYTHDSDEPIPASVERPYRVTGGAPNRRWNRNGVMETVAWSTSHSAFDAGVWAMSNDPCPAGWRLPTEAELTLLIMDSSIDRGKWLDSDAAADRGFGCQPGRLMNNIPDHTPLFAPASGIRGCNGGSPAHGELRNVGFAGYFWSRERRAPIADNYPYHAFYSEVTMGGTGSNARTRHPAQGLSVRCVRQYVPQLSDPMYICPALAHRYDLPALPGTLTEDNFHLGGPLAGIPTNASGIIGRNHYQWQRSANGGNTWELVLGGMFAQPYNYNIHLFLTVGQTQNTIHPANFTHIRRVVIWDGRRFYSNATPIAIPQRDYIAAAAVPYTVVINNRIWATRNLDLSRPTGFTAYPHEGGMFFQFNRPNGWSYSDNPRQMWNVHLNNGGGIGTGANTGNWATPTPAWPTILLPPNPAGTDWGVGNHIDPCRLIPPTGLPAGNYWRMPTRDELASLIDLHDLDWITHTIHEQTNFGCQPGGRFRCPANPDTTNPAQFLFLPAVGHRDQTTGNFNEHVLTQSNWANYWASTPHAGAGYGFGIRFQRHPATGVDSSQGHATARGTRGNPVRCIAANPAP